MIFYSPAEIKANFSLHNTSAIERERTQSLKNHLLENMGLSGIRISKLS